MIGYEIERNPRTGAYVLPHPETGARSEWPRATARTKVLSDTTGLTKWKLRKVAAGLVTSPELRNEVAELVGQEETKETKKALGDVCERAMKAAGSGDASEAGTQLHELIEAVDNQVEVKIPRKFAKDVKAYQRTMTEAGIGHLGGLTERTVINMTIGVAGTFDAIKELPDGSWVMADLKTGQDLRYGWGDIAVQLAVYANADCMYDPRTKELVDMPSVDPSVGLIMHLPVGQGQCDLWALDIGAGWEAALLAKRVIEWRGRRDLARKLDIAHLARQRDLRYSIDLGSSPEALEQLWRDNKALWTPGHTYAALARKEQLRTQKEQS